MELPMSAASMAAASTDEASTDASARCKRRREQETEPPAPRELSSSREPCKDAPRSLAPRSPLLPASILCLSFALLISSLWASLGRSSFFAIAGTPGRLVFVVACFALAWHFRNHVPSVKVLAGSGTALIAASIAFRLMRFGIVDKDMSTVVEALDTVCVNLGSAILFLLIAQMSAPFSRRVCAIGVPASYLVASCVYALTVFVLPEPVPCIVMAASPLLAALGVLACACICLSGRPVRGMQPIQCGFAAGERRPFPFLENDAEWVPLIFGTTLFPLLFSTAAQLCLVMGGSGLYGAPNEFAAAVFPLVLILYGARSVDRISYGRVLALCVPLMSCGFAVLPWLGGTNGLVGQILIKTGFIVYQVLFWVLLLGKIRHDPRHAYMYSGLFLGLFMLAKAVGRMVVFSADTAVDATLLSWQVATGALWVICTYTLIFFVVAARSPLSAMSGVRDRRDGDEAEGQAELAEPADSFSLKIDAFCRRYGLSPREREVMELAVHGFTMRAIGQQLYIAEDTVKTYLRRVYAKVDVANKQGLVAMIDGYAPEGTASQP